jgi:hypothetical protein
MERSSVILYVYELQIETDSEKKGFGRFLMRAVELIALKHKMEAVMSTVFKANMPARLFDQKMKYQMHSTSLEMSREEALEATYDHWTNLSSKSRNIRRKAWKCVIFVILPFTMTFMRWVFLKAISMRQH